MKSGSSLFIKVTRIQRVKGLATLSLLSHFYLHLKSIQLLLLSMSRPSYVKYGVCPMKTKC